MIPVKKQHEPRGLRNAKRNNTNLEYENKSKTGFSQDKQYEDDFFKLRTSLLDEQGKICCYCQKKIPTVKNEYGNPLMKTEHFIPKNGKEADTSLQLEYSNLLASCKGNSDKKGVKFKDHCDSSKGHKRLKILPNPAEIRQVNCNHFFKYKVRLRQEYVVVIAPNNENEDLKSDIELLNLNEQNLRIERFSVWKGLWRVVYNERKNKLNISKLINILDDHDFTKTIEPSKRDFKEFCGFIIQWFENRFKDELAQARK
jgi:uncharacterized protein (TIGR02646 family)